MAETPWERLTEQAYELARAKRGEYEDFGRMREALIEDCARRPEAWKPVGEAAEILSEAAGERDSRLDPAFARVLGSEEFKALGEAGEAAPLEAAPLGAAPLKFAAFCEQMVREMLLLEALRCGRELVENPRWSPWGEIDSPAEPAP